MATPATIANLTEGVFLNWKIDVDPATRVYYARRGDHTASALLGRGSKRRQAKRPSPRLLI